MGRTLELALLALMGAALSSCIGMLAQAPVSASLNWRGTEDIRFATTEGHVEGETGTQTVQADKTTELDSAVSTSAGTATTGGTGQGKE